MAKITEKTTFKRDPKTGELLVFRNGKPHGKMETMGDEIGPENKKKKDGDRDGKH